MKAPSVKRKSLVFTAGLIWSMVGVYLIIFSVILMSGHIQYLVMISGLLIGFLVHKFGFSKIVNKNLNRIESLAQPKDELCMFAFQSWKSYLLVMIMITLGVLIRHSSLNVGIKAEIYLIIGSALLLSSIIYYREILTGRK